jgi:GNAT superfamily N-acetyltransferase
MLTIREMAVEDMLDVRKLLTQLGYDLGPSEVRRRYEAVAQAAGHALFVADIERRVIGLLHLYARPALEKPPEVIVQALVVDEVVRGRGVGRAMMKTAEQWAHKHSFASVALTSHISRSDAHAFYEALGYRLESTSRLMRKYLEL